MNSGSLGLHALKASGTPVPGAASWVEASHTLADDESPNVDHGWGLVELFLCVQLLWGAVLFLPGAQAFRPYLRALPYLTSAALLAYYFRRPTGEPLHASAKWVVASLGLLLVNLLHPTSHGMAGVAQFVFQLSICAPVLWMTRAVRSETTLARLLWIWFGASGLGSVLGVLQVYYPDAFLPPQFSTLGLELNPEFVSSLTYRGADGREIVRPPGLSDMPGGAAVSAAMTVMLGVTLAFRSYTPVVARAACLALAAVGMTALLLTQVRSLTLVTMVSVMVFAGLRVRQGRAATAVASLAFGGALFVGAFLWAVAVGGDSLSTRFLGLIDDGVVETFKEQRGSFLTYTLTELLWEYPLGAGLGRWGMMHVYFGDASHWQAPPIHVEIQPTGWLLDGGVPMWLVMGLALLVSLRATYVVAVRTTGSLQESAATVLCLQVALLATCFTGPAFNTYLGIQYWAMAAALWGPVVASEASAEVEAG